MSNTRTGSRCFGHVMLGILLLFSSSQIAAAQRPAPPSAGERVRVVSIDEADRLAVVFVGRLVRLNFDTVTIASASHPDWTFALGSGYSLQVRRGGGSRAGKGALIGTATGVLLGAIAPCGDSSGGFGAPTCSDLRPAVMLVLGGVGALLGTFIGLAMSSERWNDVFLEPPIGGLTWHAIPVVGSGSAFSTSFAQAFAHCGDNPEVRC